MLPDADDYDTLRAAFRWPETRRCNMGVAACDAWARRDPDRLAIIQAQDHGPDRRVTYGEMRHASDRLAVALRARGIKRGDRVALLLPQSLETAIAHIALYKIEAIAVPLAALFGTDALSFRLRDAGVRAVVTDAGGLAKIRAIAESLPDLDLLVSVDGAEAGALDFHRLIADAVGDAPEPASGPDDPAIMIYTSGTTGPPKGALHGHRVLMGHVPGLQYTHMPFPADGDLMWTPSDWAWAGGLFNMLLPALSLGVPVVARAGGRFEPEAAFGLMERLSINRLFVPPTALRMLRAVERPRERFRLSLRSIGSAGESLGAETYHWGREALGLPVDEFYGQTECNYVLGSCSRLGVSRAGTIGRAVPGHDANVIRPDGTVCDADEEGEIAVRRPDPVMFLGYWNQPEATEAKFIGDWMRTGDRAVRDADGYVRFVGRDDDVITSAGYRIGPGEIEDCLLKHPAVALAAAVGKPDALRTEIVKAFVQLKPGHAPSGELAADIKAFVRMRLSAHEYPRELDFVDELPMTTTGKIIRRALREG